MYLNKVKMFLISLGLTVLLFIAERYIFTTGKFVYREFYVTKVIDGDTIEISNGEKVRLLGINSPERGRYFYSESKNYLENKVLNRKVTIDLSSVKRDSYNRLLAFVFVDGENLNLELVKKGLAHTFRLREVNKYKKELREAEKYAREKELGIWKKSNFSNCIVLRKLVFIGNEKLFLENICDFDISLNGWIIEDESHNYLVFDNFVLNKKSTKLVCIKKDASCDYTFSKNLSIFDREGDKFFLRDSRGFLVIFYEY